MPLQNADAIFTRLTQWMGQATTKMTKLGSLACGTSGFEGSAANALAQIQTSVETLSLRCVDFVSAPFSIETRLFGLFCARVLLETCCAALSGRIDPFRLLYLSAFQQAPEYDIKRPIKTAFNWTGDVVSRSPPNQKLWSPDLEGEKISRALFSQYLDILIWRPGVERALDFITPQSAGFGLEDFKKIEPETFIDVTRGRCTQLYSTLSKGVHFEFFDSVQGLDESTIKNAIREVLVTTSRLALVSHFVPTAHANLAAAEAVEQFVAFHGQMQ